MAPKKPPRWPKRPPRWPKRPPRRIKMSPGTRKSCKNHRKTIVFYCISRNRYDSLLEPLQGPPEGPRDRQNGPKMALGRPKTAPRRPKTAPRRPKRAPRRPQDAPKTAQEAPKKPPRQLRDASRSHLGSRISPGSLLGTSRTLPERLWRPLGAIFMSKCWPPTRTKKPSRVQSRHFPSSVPYQQSPKVLLTHHASLGAGGRGRSPSDKLRLIFPPD